jgi:hypothetical protein
MGRKAIWTPHHIGLAEINTTHANTKIICDYLLFCETQDIRPGPDATVLFARSMLDAGLDPSSIANRVEMVRRIRRSNARAILGHLKVQAMLSTLRQLKVRSGGPKRKPYISIDTFETFLHKSTAFQTHESNTTFQIIFFVLLCTGARPNETHSMRIRRVCDGLHVQFNGRKRHNSSSAAYYFWPFDWSLFPPQHIIDAWDQHVVDEKLPAVGHRDTVATHINSWLARIGAHFTSTAPRVRMDNVLRDFVQMGTLTIPELEDRMGHTWQVSTNSYARS